MRHGRILFQGAMLTDGFRSDTHYMELFRARRMTISGGSWIQPTEIHAFPQSSIRKAHRGTGSGCFMPFPGFGSEQLTLNLEGENHVGRTIL